MSARPAGPAGPSFDDAKMYVNLAGWLVCGRCLNSNLEYDVESGQRLVWPGPDDPDLWIEQPAALSLCRLRPACLSDGGPRE